MSAPFPYFPDSISDSNDSFCISFARAASLPTADGGRTWDESLLDPFSLYRSHLGWKNADVFTLVNLLIPLALLLTDSSSGFLDLLRIHCGVAIFFLKGLPLFLSGLPYVVVFSRSMEAELLPSIAHCNASSIKAVTTSSCFDANRSTFVFSRRFNILVLIDVTPSPPPKEGGLDCMCFAPLSFLLLLSSFSNGTDLALLRVLGGSFNSGLSDSLFPSLLSELSFELLSIEGDGSLVSLFVCRCRRRRH
mmetsp:Transcript_12679/g.19528  ORF Transcript_12679/g.19528 Transcript_12679/m.19528 type:complete len:249 (+) Transcript_12679:1739-2485(+)